jgi:antitoxin (DNA-binding transcriptional repressor) of toxin-antitoxin stability system
MSLQRDLIMPKATKMPSITLSQLRHTKRVRAWLRAGKIIELRERNRVIAHIVPVKQEPLTAKRLDSH